MISGNQRKLEETSEKEQKSHLYMDIIVLIEEIADYIIPENNEIRKGLGEIMGGKILKLRSEELLEQGEARGRLQDYVKAGLPDYMKPKLMRFKI